MRRVAILGAGLVTSGGQTLGDTWRSIINGKVCSSNVLPRFVGHVKSTKANFAVCFSNKKLFTLSCLAIEEAKMFLPDHMSFNAVCLGSTSAGFDEEEHGILAPGPGGLVDSIASFYHIPMKFQVSQACSSSGHAIALGVDLIRLGLADTVLVGGADEVTVSVMAAFEAVKLHSDECKPFDANRSGLTLGDAAAFLVLAKEGLGEPMAYIDGVGLNCDAKDSVAPAVEGISRVYRNALFDMVNSGIKPEIQFVIAHGTGTKLNDKIELEAITDICAQVGAKKPPVASYKGSIGHPQGASGAVSVCLAVKMLLTRKMIPNVGLSNVDESLPFTLLPIEAASFDGDRIMTLSYGSWGTNAAIVVGRT
jgi:Beta-ketoacyl synthase, C-terminal domain/Beta-ketoacyl synthase, N-terminal domain